MALSVAMESPALTFNPSLSPPNPSLSSRDFSVVGDSLRALSCSQVTRYAYAVATMACVESLKSVSFAAGVGGLRATAFRFDWC